MILAQLADLLTYLAMGPARELNPLASALGPSAVLAKLVLIGFLIVLLPLLATHRPRLARFVRAEAIVAGVFGAATNVLTIFS